MMNNEDRERPTPLPVQENHRSGWINDHELEERITHFFHQRAQTVHFTPVLRNQTLRRLSPHHIPRLARPLTFSLAALAMLVIISTCLFYFAHPFQPLSGSGISYTIEKTISLPPAFADGGQLISLDPTTQRFVYQAAHQPGVMYTADLSAPITSNLLAMRSARDAAWSPDGSALVATITTPDSSLPALALIPNGQYMHELGHSALAASWLPTARTQITYVLPTNGTTQLWHVDPTGLTPHLQATMPQQLTIQHLLWSPDAHALALTVTTDGVPLKTALDLPARTIYLMDAHTLQLQQLSIPAHSTIGALRWSPDGRYLAYEQTDAHQLTTLQVISAASKKTLFQIIPQQTLQGWNWSNDSQSILYSAGGTLHVHMLTTQTTKISFPKTYGQQISPFYLKDGRILYVQVLKQKETLIILGRKTHKL